MPLLLGIDIGTTSVKAGLFDAKGKSYGVVLRDYQLQTPAVDYVELDATTYWAATLEVVSSLLDNSGISLNEIVGIGVSSQGETIIPVDGNGNPLNPAIIWLDNRAQAEARLLEDKLGKVAYQHTGIPAINPTWPACKIAWLKNNLPEIYEASKKFLLVQDFIVYQLTGKFVTEGSISCTTLYYDIVKNIWWQEALDAIGLSATKLPDILMPGAVAGTLRKSAAEAIGLPAGIPVVMGGMDQSAGAVGAGNIFPAIISETTGGALTIQATVPNPDVDPTGQIPVYIHSVPGNYLFVPVCDTGGMALKWFRDNFCTEELEKAQIEGVDVYDLLTKEADKASPGSDGLLMLPHLTGAFSPEYNTDARGVFFGFTLYHQKRHFIRAILESVAFMLRKNLEIIFQTGIQAKEIRTTGGGAQSRLWRQIKADVCQLPVVTLQNHDTALLGDALLAGVAVGVFSTYEEGVREMVAIAEKLEPNSLNTAVYENAYENYCQLYDTLEPLFRKQFGSFETES